MVSNNIINIILKAEDHISKVVNKTNSSFQKLGSEGEKSFKHINNSSEGLNKELKNIERSGQNMTTGLVNKFQNLSQSIHKNSLNMNNFKNTIDHLKNSTSNGLSRMTSGFGAFKNRVGTVFSNIKSKLENFAYKLGTTGQLITSAFGVLGFNSIKDMTLGLAMARERMTNLMSATMGSGDAAKSFVQYLDQMTNKSLVNLNMLGDALNNIKMSTSMSNAELKMISPIVNDIGQRAILMGKSNDEVLTIMQSSFKGLNGEFDILHTNFGISHDKLVSLGWSGASDDVKGYTQALEKYLEQSGSMTEMMKTTDGQIALIKKGFSTAGREIGEVFLPIFKIVLDLFLFLKNTHPELFKLIIIIGGLITTFAMLLPILLPLISAFEIIFGLFQGLGFVLAANPIGVVIVAIGLLVVGLIYLYNNFKPFRDIVNNVFNAFKKLGEYIWNNIIKVFNELSKKAAPLINFLNGIKIALSNLLGGNKKNNLKVDFFSGIEKGLKSLYDIFSKVGGYLQTILMPVFKLYFDHVNTLFETGYGIIKAYFGFIFSILNTIFNLLQGKIGFMEALKQIWDNYKEFLNNIFNVINKGIGKFLLDIIFKIMNGFKNLINNVSMILSQLPSQVLKWLSMTGNKIRNSISGFIFHMKQGATQLVNGFINIIKALPGKVWIEFKRIGTYIMNAGRWFVTQAKNAANKLKNSFLNALGIKSPGDMYKATRGELLLIGDEFDKQEEYLGNKAEILSESIKEGFNLETLENININPQIGDITRGSGLNNVLEDINLDFKMPENNSASLLKGNDNINNSFAKLTQNVGSNLEKLVKKDTSSWNNIKSSNQNNLKNIQKSTTESTKKMMDSWNYMKNNINQAADNIKTGVGSKIKNLGFNIKIFYNKLIHPQRWLSAGPMPNNSNSFSNIMSAGPVMSKDSNLLNDKELVNMPWDCNNCYAGYESIIRPNHDKIMDNVHNYPVHMPLLPNNLLKVKDFKNTSNPMKGKVGLFEAIWRKMISKTNYEFYFNSKYGAQGALKHGSFNCYDGALLTIALARNMGLNAHMIHGHWGRVPHVGAMVNGRLFDTTQMQLRGTPRGATGVGFSGPIPSMNSHDNIKGDEIILNININQEFKNNTLNNDDIKNATRDGIIETLNDPKVIDKLTTNKRFKIRINEGLKDEISNTKRINGV